MYKRFGRKWDVPEIIALQREYELLELTIDQIAEKHKRSPNAIMRKLDKEGFAVYEDLLQKYENQKIGKENTKIDNSIEETELSCSTVNTCQIEISDSTNQVIEDPKNIVSLFEEINIEGSEDVKLENITEQKEVRKNSMCVLS